jgi:cytochrome c553
MLRLLIALILCAACCARAQAPAERLKECATCHGADGVSTTVGVPSLAGQQKVFLENQLVLVREGLRGTELMQKLMHGVSDKEIVAIAEHYSRATPRPVAGEKTDSALIERGRQAAQKHKCGVCHLADHSGQNQVPRIAGQREDYLLESMRAFRDKPKPGTDTIMSAALYGVSDEELRALAHFLAREK